MLLQEEYSGKIFGELVDGELVPKAVKLPLAVEIEKATEEEKQAMNALLNRINNPKEKAASEPKSTPPAKPSPQPKPTPRPKPPPQPKPAPEPKPTSDPKPKPLPKPTKSKSTSSQKQTPEPNPASSQKRTPDPEPSTSQKVTPELRTTSPKRTPEGQPTSDPEEHAELTEAEVVSGGSCDSDFGIGEDSFDTSFLLGQSQVGNSGDEDDGGDESVDSEHDGGDGSVESEHDGGDGSVESEHSDSGSSVDSSSASDSDSDSDSSSSSSSGSSSDVEGVGGSPSEREGTKEEEEEEEKKTVPSMEIDCYKRQVQMIIDVESVTMLEMAALSCPELSWNALGTDTARSTNESLDYEDICSKETLQQLEQAENFEYKVRKSVARGRNMPKIAWKRPQNYICVECRKPFPSIYHLRRHLEWDHKHRQSRDIAACHYCARIFKDVKGKREHLNACAWSHNPCKKLVEERDKKKDEEKRQVVRNRFFCPICLNVEKHVELLEDQYNTAVQFALKNNKPRPKKFEESDVKSVYKGFSTQANYRDHLAGAHNMLHLKFFCAICARPHSKDTSRQACQKACLQADAPFRCYKCIDSTTKDRVIFESMRLKAEHFVQHHPRLVSALYVNDVNKRIKQQPFVEARNRIEQERLSRKDAEKKRRAEAAAAALAASRTPAKPPGKLTPKKDKKSKKEKKKEKKKKKKEKKRKQAESDDDDDQDDSDDDDPTKPPKAKKPKTDK